MRTPLQRKKTLLTLKRMLRRPLLLREMTSQLLRKVLKMQRKRAMKVERGKVEKKRSWERKQLEMKSWEFAMRIRVGLSQHSGFYLPFSSPC